jgi:hypothetical protein
MPETRTIFLATDGRHHTLGRGDAVEPSEHFVELVTAGGQPGWIAILSGNPNGKRKVSLARVHAMNGAQDGQWDAAVAAFDSIRNGIIPPGTPTLG